MKKLQLILLLAVGIVIASCGGDDDSADPELTTANIAGTYNLTFIESTYVESIILDAGTVVTTTETVGDTFGDSNIVLSANGTYTTNFQYRITETTMSTIEGSEATVDTEIINESDSGTYSISEENQTITFDGSANDVTRFDGEDLRLEFSSNDTFDDGTETFNTEIRFVRQ